MKQRGFFDEAGRRRKLSELGDSLEKLNEHIEEEEEFRGILAAALKKETQRPERRLPYDYLMMFKILILQKIYNIGDDQAEHPINDRLSFQRFLCLQLCDTVSDTKTIWSFKEGLKEAGIGEETFNGFSEKLERKEMITRSESIVDATFEEILI